LTTRTCLLLELLALGVPQDQSRLHSEDRELVVPEGVGAVDSEEALEAVTEVLAAPEVSKEVPEGSEAVPEVSKEVPEVLEVVLEAVPEVLELVSEAVPEVLEVDTAVAAVLEAVKELEVSEEVPEVDTAVEPAPEALAVAAVVDHQVQWCQY
jgi:hypothetical protein